jgi:hypothetical protein
MYLNDANKPLNEEPAGVDVGSDTTKVAEKIKSKFCSN